VCTILAIGLAAPCLRAAEDSTAADEQPGEGPRIAHTPVFQVLRGQPVTIATEINTNKAAVKDATLYVKLTEIQKPIEYPMQNAGSNLWQATIPAPALLPVDRFWYYIKATDVLDLFSDTAWQPVSIVSRLAKGTVAASVAGQSGGGGAPGGSAPWLIGGALFLGGGAAIIAGNSDDDDNDDDPPGNPAPAVSPTSSNDKNDDSGGGSDDSDSEPPCELTGNEQVLYNHLSPFGKDGGLPIEIVVCDACPDARIVVIGSWGSSDIQDAYNNPSCSTTDPGVILELPKPEGFDGCESESIVVLSNGRVIDTIPWPDCDDF
jgi:hypothetical protein